MSGGRDWKQKPCPTMQSVTDQWLANLNIHIALISVILKK